MIEHPRKKPPRLTILTGDSSADAHADGRHFANGSGGGVGGAMLPPTAPPFASAMATSTSTASPWSPINGNTQRDAPSAIAAFMPTIGMGDAMNGARHLEGGAGGALATGGRAQHSLVRSQSNVQASVHYADTGCPFAEKSEKHKKRGRVESANATFDDQPVNRAPSRSHATTMMQSMALGGRIPGAHSGLVYSSVRNRRGLPRSHSSPNFVAQVDNTAITNIFPDINPRNLRIAEVKSWYCDWMDKDFQVPEEESDAQSTLPHAPYQADESKHPASPLSDGGPYTPPLQSLNMKARMGHQKENGEPNEVDEMIAQINSEFTLEEKFAAPAILETPVSNGTSAAPLSKTSSISKRPQLRLKLEDMPTPQQAENRAQRAANRLIAKREAAEKEMIASSVPGTGGKRGDGGSATQNALLRLNFKSYSSGDDSDLQSPSVSEAGISSPDSNCLHLQENLERVKEIGRGASGTVYKAIHIPTLKVVAIKDVPVYGRGQRRQMVRELHALYSNLVPMSENGRSGQSSSQNGDSRPKPSPYIVSFYDAFVDRPKNSICLVMEYMSTGSLQDIVLRGGCQNEKILARLATGVLQGLAHIHRKRMIHRDIKPHNLLTNRQGEVKISDFGLARTLNDNSSTTKTFVGTLLYMAPERIGGGDYSYPADIWSFGLALISVAFGKYPLPTQDGFFGLVDSIGVV
ncbi:Serine/threonine protein kinase, variant 1, partial [Globisporangium splendens]